MLRKTIVGSLGGLLLSAFLGATPSLSFKGRGQVVVSGVTTGGRVAVFSISQFEKEFVRQILPHRELITDSDRDGAVQVAQDPVVSKSIWAAVDLATGQFVVGAPAPYLPTQISFDPAAALRSNPVTDAVAAGRQHLHLLLVRPGQGAWHRVLNDGGTADSGPGSDNEVVADLIDLETLGFGLASVAPSRISAGDVLVGIDPMLLEYFVYQEPATQGIR